MPKKAIDQVEVTSRKVLTRVDFNVPLNEQGCITDDRRIREALPTIQSVIGRGGRLILMSHLGRPEGKGFEPSLTLKPAADRLGELLDGMQVGFPDRDCVSAKTAASIESIRDGELLLLENLRFHPGEKKSDPGFASKLASYGDLYCNDAFGAAHRSDASMVAVPKAMTGKPRIVGLLMKKELQFLSEAIRNPKHPFIAVLGGAKVSDKLGVIRHLMNRVDQILIGGGMAYTFLKALGQEMGSSMVQNGMLRQAQEVLDLAAASPTDLVFPKDHVCGKQISHITPVNVFEDNIPQGWMGLDIGPGTTAQYAQRIMSAQTIIWNGPMGVFETPPFDVGTRQVAGSMVKATAGGAISMLAGGDTAAAVESFGMASRFSHVSTGGGACLEMLAGKAFDSLSVLDEA